MKKIRPKRIIEGVVKTIGEKHTPSSIDRKRICDNCDKKKNGVCTICLCVVKAKSKVFEEYCPMNKWNDIKILKKVGVALALKNPEKVTLSVDEEETRFVLDYGKIKEKEAVLQVVVINDRGNYFTENKILSNIKVITTCGCTTLTPLPVILKEGAFAEFELKYNPKEIKPFSKKVTIKTDETEFNILLKGEVIK